MKVERKDLANSVVELVVEQSVENVKKLRKTVLKEIEKNADIKGFRKGSNIPEEVILREFGEEKIRSMIVERAIDSMYREALRKEKLMPVAQGEIKEIVSESPLTIKIHIEVLPQVELDKKYKEVSIKKKRVSVTEKEVKEALNDIEKRFTKFEETEDKKVKLKMGDRATIDTQGYDEKKKELANTNMSNYPIVLGSNILVPGFEEKMVGAKLGEELTLDIDFPKDYHNADFAGKSTIFTVKINKIEKAVKPEFTEEFIEQLRGKKLDLEGFKDLIKEEIKETKAANAKMEEEQALIDGLLKHTKLDVGEKLLQEQTQRVFEEIKENMAQSGVKMPNYLESLKMTEEEYKEKHVKETALRRLQGELILAKVVELEKIEVEDKELKKEVEKIIEKYGSEEVKKRLEEIYVPGNKYYEELRQRLAYKTAVEGFYEKK